MKKKKILAVFLYSSYVIFLTLLLIFGAKLSSWASTVVDGIINKKQITDVTADKEPTDELLADRDHYIKYTAHGDFTGDPGLRFTSLDPEHVVVTSTGIVRARLNFEGDYFDGRIKVTSRYDSDFEKVLTFRFVKKIPNEFIAAYYVKGYAHGVKNLKVGVPVYVFSHTEQRSGYNIWDYNVEYDEEYFTQAPDGSLIPIKMTPEGVSLNFKVVYYNGRSAQSSSFIIGTPAEEVTEIDEIRFDGQSADDFIGIRKKSAIITLYNDGQPVMTDYTVSYADKSDINFSRASHISFFSAGDKEVTFTLPNGFSKTVTLKIRNVIKEPIIDEVEDDTEVIYMDYSEVRTFYIGFASDVTYDGLRYEFDKDSLDVVSNGRRLIISPRKSGVTSVKIIVSDGYDTVTKTLTIEVGKSPGIVTVIAKNVAKFVAKIMGHVALFAFLAVLSMYMFRYIYIVEPWKRFILYVMTALPAAALTEYAQTFIPGRSGRIQDVIIDMSGFFFGTLFVLVLNAIIERIISARKRKSEKLKNSMILLRSHEKLNIAK